MRIWSSWYTPLLQLFGLPDMKTIYLNSTQPLQGDAGELKQRMRNPIPAEQAAVEIQPSQRMKTYLVERGWGGIQGIQSRVSRLGGIQLPTWRSVSNTSCHLPGCPTPIRSLLVGTPPTPKPQFRYFRGGSKNGRRIFGAGHWLGANWAPPGDNYTALPDKALARPASPWDT